MTDKPNPYRLASASGDKPASWSGGGGPERADGPGDPNEPSPSLLWWPVHLLLQPRRFFQHYGGEPIPVLTAIFAWLYGMAGVIDRIDGRAMMRPDDYSFLLDDWLPYLMVVVFGGVLGGALYYLIGGWWYRVRLGFCGAKEADPDTARRVYLYASQVPALPILLLLGLDVLRFDTPREAMFSADPLWWICLVGIVFMFWSIGTSYAGVRTVFPVRRGPAVVWFIALPAVMYTLGLGVMVGSLVMVTLAQPPDVAHPQTYRGPVLEFRYPGNWWVTPEPGMPAGAAELAVEGGQDAVIRVMVYESASTLEEELAASHQLLGTEGDGWTEGPRFEKLGRFEGVGQVSQLTMDGRPYDVRVFLHELAPGRVLEIWELSESSVTAEVRPGFDQVVGTLQVVPAGDSP